MALYAAELIPWLRRSFEDVEIADISLEDYIAVKVIFYRSRAMKGETLTVARSWVD